MIASQVAMPALLFVVEKSNPRRKNRGFFYLPLAMHLPAALHLAGILQPGQGLNEVDFLPSAFSIFMYIFLEPAAFISLASSFFDSLPLKGIIIFSS